jgi:hypothetical protein
VRKVVERGKLSGNHEATFNTQLIGDGLKEVFPRFSCAFDGETLRNRLASTFSITPTLSVQARRSKSQFHMHLRVNGLKLCFDISNGRKVSCVCCEEPREH